jgi:hypothetical protein
VKSKAALPKPSTLLKQIEAETQRLQATSAQPVVAWAGMDERPKAFAARLAALKLPARTLLLAVVPHGYPVPPRAQAVSCL